MFDLHTIEKGGSTDKMSIFTFQAMTEEEFEAWVSITGGQINVSKPQLSSKAEIQSKDDCLTPEKNIDRVFFFFR